MGLGRGVGSEGLMGTVRRKMEKFWRRWGWWHSSVNVLPWKMVKLYTLFCVFYYIKKRSSSWVFPTQVPRPPREEAWAVSPALRRPAPGQTGTHSSRPDPDRGSGPRAGRSPGQGTPATSPVRFPRLPLFSFSHLLRMSSGFWSCMSLFLQITSFVFFLLLFL